KGDHGTQKGFFGWFNRNFDRGSRKYRGAVRGILGRRKRFLAVFAVLVALMAVLFLRLPSSFLPAEDQGVLMAQIQTPVGATQQRTMASIAKLEQHFLENEPDTVESVFSVQGFSFSGTGQNTGIAFIKLKDWALREAAELGVEAVAMRAMAALGEIRDALAFAFSPPAVPELGTAAGFVFYLQDNAGLGHDALMTARNQLLGAAAQSALLTNVRPNGLDD